MKVRNDFVTNSSSSSFILGFTSKDKIEEELLEGTTSDLLKDVVLKDILETEQFDEKEVENRIREEMKYTAIWRIKELYMRRTGCSLQDASDYVNTDDGKRKSNSILIISSMMQLKRFLKMKNVYLLKYLILMIITLN